MSFSQLDPPIPLHVLGKGPGYAIAVIDYGQEHNLIWVTAINATGEIWCAPNPQVRMEGNWTMGRKKSPLFKGAGVEKDCVADAPPVPANAVAG